MASIWFEGIDELNTIEVQLRTKKGRIGEQGSKVVRRSALRVEALGKQFAPFKTGHLKGSIGHEFEGDGRFGAMEAVIGPEASYGHYVEFGTSRMAPHAYMGPALDIVGPDFAAACEAISDPLD